jgi:hypothetical protein
MRAGVSITRDGDGWGFTKPDGQSCDWWVDDENLARHLDFALRRRQQLDQLAAVDSFQHPDAQTIRPDGPVNPSTCTPAC